MSAIPNQNLIGPEMAKFWRFKFTIKILKKKFFSRQVDDADAGERHPTRDSSHNLPIHIPGVH